MQNEATFLGQRSSKGDDVCTRIFFEGSDSKADIVSLINDLQL